jgi:hypothetical protein
LSAAGDRTRHIHKEHAMSTNKRPKPDTGSRTITVTAINIAELPKSVTEIAQKSVNDAEAAFDNAAGVAHEAVQYADAAASAFKSRAADLQVKAIENFQANMGAAFAFARKAFEVRDPAELLKLNQEFAKERFQAFGTQAAEMSALAVALTRETVKPVQDSLFRGLSSFAKPLGA